MRATRRSGCSRYQGMSDNIGVMIEEDDVLIAGDAT